MRGAENGAKDSRDHRRGLGLGLGRGESAHGRCGLLSRRKEAVM
jgi:hypothetical protein